MDPNPQLDGSAAGVQDPLRRPPTRLNRLHEKSDTLRRPGTPTDQAWIEGLFSHIKAEWPHLDRIRDPEGLRAELPVVRHDYNTIRLHAAIGYVTPADEHNGRGPKVRAARQRGLRHARWARITYHRSQKAKANRHSPTDVD